MTDLLVFGLDCVCKVAVLPWEVVKTFFSFVAIFDDLSMVRFTRRDFTIDIVCFVCTTEELRLGQSFFSVVTVLRIYTLKSRQLRFTCAKFFLQTGILRLRLFFG
jgi:hypothetical protein